MAALAIVAIGLQLLSGASPAQPAVAQECVVTVAPPGGEVGDSRLTVVIGWPEGEVVFKPGGPGFVTSDGALGMKFGWYRGVRGRLTIEGRRLDGDATPLRSEVNNGYGDTGFQATYVIFPTPGCWEVTGRVADASVTFITRVVKIGEGPSWHRGR
jgi:hypothetical protein